ncbi:T-cell surface glycoprotein CD3 zeta chain-like [Brachionichthys hirsutus]|uniref:T-cell surface glycoprotein CD3 zeta chain-like n=1 Tax=Brachionichthys hirsutus TaxID=412623 RepID=UPI003604B3E7
MKLQAMTSGFLLLAALSTPAEAVKLYDPYMCYILDGFLGLYALIITGMFIKEKFCKPKMNATGVGVYNDRKDQNPGVSPLLARGDPERGRNRRMKGEDPNYTELTKRPDGEYRELPFKRERQRRSEQIYQGLSAATKDTYNSLQMKSLPGR